ncbi:MAG: tRNA (adenosine(37)-N6)-dimethylallyltransferase MiaA [Oscillospiraceae bacterium]|jgi:tRNA dimethylallyltransferase|nr:tRNA (adenosine(37)-N6)-dimethylallyltransferase MiaA [Oscillospiraceae bacterium]
MRKNETRPPDRRLLCVVGPTATGKTALAVALAKRLNGEVVSCDSMQVYRGMDIGTAKPTLAERDGVPHHMLDVADPWEAYSAARYAREAGEAVENILARGRLPILAGGTGLYLRALTEGLHDIPADPAVRAGWEALLAQQGPAALYEALTERDPDAAARIAPNDSRRTLRALEIITLSGRPLAAARAERENSPPRYQVLALGLTMERAALYARAEARVDDMLARGLLEEVKALRLRLPPGCTAMQAIGYKEFGLYLDGGCALPEAAADLKQATRRYAKRQLTWFTRQTDARWLDALSGDLPEQALQWWAEQK